MSIMQINLPLPRVRAMAAPSDNGRPTERSEAKRRTWSARPTDAATPPSDTRKEYFDRLYRASRDPWNCEGSYYEKGKRGTMLAALPGKHYGQALELGCSNGALSPDLAERCDHLLGVDISDIALDYARQRDYPRGNVDFLAADLPREWPRGHYDLIVISDLLYFLTRGEIRQLARLVNDSLTPAGECVLVDWRGDTGLPLSGEEAAACFVETLTGSNRHTQIINERHDGYVLQIYKARRPLD